MRCIFIVIAASLVIASQQVHAAAIITAQETVDGIALSGSGTIDLTALAFDMTIDTERVSGLGPTPGAVYVGPPSVGAGLLDQYLGITGPIFGTSAGALVTSGSGDFFGVISSGELLVPTGYVSGSLLFAESLIAGKTFADLGMAPGTFAWSWGVGPTADTFTLNVVPEPNTGILLACGLGIASTTRRRTHSSKHE